MSLITDTIKAATMETDLKKYLDKNITKWMEILNNQYKDRAERRGDTYAPMIDYAKASLNAYIDIKTFLSEKTK